MVGGTDFRPDSYGYFNGKINYNNWSYFDKSKPSVNYLDASYQSMLGHPFGYITPQSTYFTTEGKGYLNERSKIDLEYEYVENAQYSDPQDIFQAFKDHILREYAHIHDVEKKLNELLKKADDWDDLWQIIKYNKDFKWLKEAKLKKAFEDIYASSNFAVQGLTLPEFFRLCLLADKANVSRKIKDPDKARAEGEAKSNFNGGLHAVGGNYFLEFKAEKAWDQLYVLLNGDPNKFNSQEEGAISCPIKRVDESFFKSGFGAYTEDDIFDELVEQGYINSKGELQAVFPANDPAKFTLPNLKALTPAQLKDIFTIVNNTAKRKVLTIYAGYHEYRPVELYGGLMTTDRYQNMYLIAGAGLGYRSDPSNRYLHEADIYAGGMGFWNTNEGQITFKSSQEYFILPDPNYLKGSLKLWRNGRPLKEGIDYKLGMSGNIEFTEELQAGETLKYRYRYPYLDAGATGGVYAADYYFKDSISGTSSRFHWDMATKDGQVQETIIRLDADIKAGKQWTISPYVEYLKRPLIHNGVDTLDTMSIYELDWQYATTTNFRVVTKDGGMGLEYDMPILERQFVSRALDTQSWVGKKLRIRVQGDGTAQKVIVRFGTDANKYFEYTVNRTFAEDEWEYIEIELRDVVSVGGPSLQEIKYIAIGVEGDGAEHSLVLKDIQIRGAYDMEEGIQESVDVGMRFSKKKKSTWKSVNLGAMDKKERVAEKEKMQSRVEAAIRKYLGEQLAGSYSEEIINNYIETVMKLFEKISKINVDYLKKSKDIENKGKGILDLLEEEGKPGQTYGIVEEIYDLLDDDPIFIKLFKAHGLLPKDFPDKIPILLKLNPSPSELEAFEKNKKELMKKIALNLIEFHGDEDPAQAKYQLTQYRLTKDPEDAVPLYFKLQKTNVDEPEDCRFVAKVPISPGEEVYRDHLGGGAGYRYARVEATKLSTIYNDLEYTVRKTKDGKYEIDKEGVDELYGPISMAAELALSGLTPEEIEIIDTLIKDMEEETEINTIYGDLYYKPWEFMTLSVENQLETENRAVWAMRLNDKDDDIWRDELALRAVMDFTQFGSGGGWVPKLSFLYKYQVEGAYEEGRGLGSGGNSISRNIFSTKFEAEKWEAEALYSPDEIRAMAFVNDKLISKDKKTTFGYGGGADYQEMFDEEGKLRSRRWHNHVQYDVGLFNKGLTWEQRFDDRFSTSGSGTSQTSLGERKELGIFNKILTISQAREATVGAFDRGLAADLLFVRSPWYYWGAEYQGDEKFGEQDFGAPVSVSDSWEAVISPFHMWSSDPEKNMTGDWRNNWANFVNIYGGYKTIWTHGGPEATDPFQGAQYARKVGIRGERDITLVKDKEGQRKHWLNVDYDFSNEWYTGRDEKIITPLKGGLGYFQKGDPEKVYLESVKAQYSFTRYSELNWDYTGEKHIAMASASLHAPGFGPIEGNTITAGWRYIQDANQPSVHAVSLKWIAKTGKNASLSLDTEFTHKENVGTGFSIGLSGMIRW
ncbi:hypothetical protein ACFL5G_01290 [Candidatus Margulisiibacteriota bacterium]